MLLTFEGDKTLLTLHDGAVNWKIIQSTKFDYLFLEAGPKPLERDRLDYLLKTICDHPAESLIVYSPFLNSKQILNTIPELKTKFNSIVVIVHQEVRDQIENDLIVTVVDHPNHNEAFKQALLLVSSVPLTDEEHLLVDHNDEPDAMKIFKGLKDNSGTSEREEEANEYY